MLHPVAFVALAATGWPESPPAAMRGCQRTGWFLAERLAASAESLFGGRGYPLSDTRVAREFLEVGGLGCASLLFSAAYGVRT